MTGTLLHLLPLRSLRAEPTADLRSPTLHTDGFVHCSPDVETTLAVANTLYRNVDEPMVAVELDSARLSSEIRWEAADPAPPAGVSPNVLFPHVYGPLDRAAVIGVRYARRDVSGTYRALLPRGATAETLDLLPHPEGGWYRRTWASSAEVAAHGGTRPTATAIYFLLDAGETSAWHTVGSDELWLWHRGGPLTLSLGGDGQRPAERPELITLGADDPLTPQAVVPAGTWQRAHAENEVLVSCVVSPGFDFADFRTV